MIILDLCGGSGAWSKPYRDAGYDVRLITLPDDVRFVKHLDNVHGILAAPPCTCFARSGAWVKRPKEEWLEALSIVDACLRLVTMCKPAFWALENPVGMLRQYLGKPVMYFHPCDYGDPYTKKTCLWGSFNEPVKNPLNPLGMFAYKYSGREKHKRAITPPGFSQAFFEANK